MIAKKKYRKHTEAETNTFEHSGIPKAQQQKSKYGPVKGKR